jgi:hypothetical protein
MKEAMPNEAMPEGIIGGRDHRRPTQMHIRASQDSIALTPEFRFPKPDL